MATNASSRSCTSPFFLPVFLPVYQVSASSERMADELLNRSGDEWLQNEAAALRWSQKTSHWMPAERTGLLMNAITLPQHKDGAGLVASDDPKVPFR